MSSVLLGCSGVVGMDVEEGFSSLEAFEAVDEVHLYGKWWWSFKDFILLFFKVFLIPFPEKLF